MKLKYIALIPAYEPDEKLIKLSEELKKENFFTIIVNDGSDSNFDDIFTKCQNYAHVINYEKNHGKGYALKTGLNYIKSNFQNDFVIVTLDSDGQHSVTDAKKLCDIAKSQNTTIITGKRIRSKKTPLRSRVGNSITRFIYKIITGTDIYDTQTGLRAFNNTLLDYMLSINGNRYEYEMNVLLNTKKNSIVIKEVEIETIYFDNNHSSHFKTLKDSFRVYKEILKFSLSSILSFGVDYLLYSILVLLSSNILIANIVSRFLSASFNFTLNNNFVFKSNKKVTVAFLEYLTLALIILILNTLILNIFVNMFGVNAFISKIFTELILFCISLFFQKKVIFTNKKEEYNEN